MSFWSRLFGKKKAPKPAVQEWRENLSNNNAEFAKQIRKELDESKKRQERTPLKTETVKRHYSNSEIAKTLEHGEQRREDGNRSKLKASEVKKTSTSYPSRSSSSSTRRDDDYSSGGSSFGGGFFDSGSSFDSDRSSSSSSWGGSDSGFSSGGGDFGGGGSSGDW